MEAVAIADQGRILLIILHEFLSNVLVVAMKNHQVDHI
jgi:hypothetical protein